MARLWGRFVTRHRWWVLGAWVAVVATAATISVQTPRLLSPAGFSADTEAARAERLVQRHFPDRRFPDLYVVFHSDTVTLADTAYQAQVGAWRQDLERVTRDLNARVPEPIPGQDGRTVALVVESNMIGDQALDLARRARAIHHPGPAQTYLGGGGPVYDAFITNSEADLQASEWLSTPIAILLLLLVFGGLVAAGLPVLTGLATVTAAVAMLGLATRLQTVSVFALNLSSVLGIGLGIDYSLLVLTRFREELRRGSPVEEAVVTTVATAGMATVVSGGTVMIGFGALLISHLNVLWSIGLGGMLVVAISVLASLTLMPALLAVFGGGVNRLALPFARGRDTSAFWRALAAGVMRWPVLAVAATVAIVALLAWPARDFRPGVVGAESLPPGDPTVTADRLAQQQLGFSPRSPILVVAQGVEDPVAAHAVEAEVRRLAGTLTVRGADEIPPPLLTLYLRPPYAIVEVEQPAADNDDATHHLLDRLRSGRWPPGVRVTLSGEAAAYQDFLNLLLGEFPAIFALVIGMTLVLLGISFRSLALPLKAVLMNLLSVTAAMGILTWVFQEGHLARQLDFQAVGFVDAVVPVIIFAGLFGLSMDYEVFLLSRIREEHEQGLDNTQAVAAGMERTGQIITSAALILVAVASTLDLSHLTVNKSLGVTFAAAILLDATLIRLVMVPAMMRLLGRLNWWPGRASPLAPIGRRVCGGRRR